jgi:hypothetical protein
MARNKRSWVVWIGLGLLGSLVASATYAEESVNPLPWLDNDIYKVSIDMRGRIELADMNGLQNSEAYTVRTRLGLGFKPWNGFSAFAELENTTSAEKDSYFDGASAPDGKTVIADPQNTELNRAFGQYENADWADLKIKGGRQRIIFDDARFIGNVGWRQNEQTYDAGLIKSSLGIEGLTTEYAYLWNIQRIFGDKGPTPATQDFTSESHLLRAHYTGIDNLKLTAFAYLLDFGSDSPVNSANSYGVRVAGNVDLSDEMYLKYVGSYAFQKDEADNPVSYDAHYVLAEGTLGTKKLGAFTTGYELLGSDNGDARFVTPLATGHKHNGWADAFLNNGGVRGLQDLYFAVAPKLPMKLKGKLVYHRFWSHEHSSNLGYEIDGVVSRKLNKYVTALTKFAYFDGTNKGPADRWRLWFQLTLKY